MAQLKPFRCWYHDGSMRLISAKDHRSAALEAQELAGIANADIRDSNRDEFLKRSKVKTVEEIETGRKVRYRL